MDYGKDFLWPLFANCCRSEGYVRMNARLRELCDTANSISHLVAWHQRVKYDRDCALSEKELAIYVAICALVSAGLRLAEQCDSEKDIGVVRAWLDAVDCFTAEYRADLESEEYPWFDTETWQTKRRD